jgi:hypothetical protein
MLSGCGAPLPVNLIKKEKFKQKLFSSEVSQKRSMKSIFAISINLHNA